MCFTFLIIATISGVPFDWNQAKGGVLLVFPMCVYVAVCIWLCVYVAVYVSAHNPVSFENEFETDAAFQRRTKGP